MKRSLLFVAAVLFCLSIPLSGYAQGIPGTSAGLFALPSFPGSGPPASYPSCGGGAGCDPGGLKLVSLVRAGYGKIGLNFNLPVPPTDPAGFVTFNIAHLDLRLDDANLWLGNVLVDLWITPDIDVFVEGWGSAGRVVRNQMIEEPIEVAAPPVIWDSSLEWWELGFGASYRIRGPAFVTGGLKFEHLSANLKDPRNLVGGPLVPGVAERLEGDLRTKLTIPYFGMAIQGPNYRGAILYSPFAWADVDVPLNAFTVIPIPDWPALLALEGVTYSFTRSGLYLEGLFDYSVRLAPGFNAGVWARGTYVKFRGSGDENLTISTSGAIEFTASLNNSATGSLTRSIIAGGLNAELSF